MKTIPIFSIFIVLIALEGCRYSRPLISYRHLNKRRYSSDSTKKESLKHYTYLSINSLGLKSSYSKKKEFNAQGIVIKMIMRKRIPGMTFDPPFNSKFITKIIYYDNNGKKVKTEYDIYRFYQDRFDKPKTIVKKVVYFEEKGKKIVEDKREKK